MCYRVARDFDDVEAKNIKEFEISGILASFNKKYNVSITSDMPVIIPGSRILDLYRWGLIPHFVKDKAIGAKLANARSETIDIKPMFKDSFKTKRCLVLASGFFEWDKNKKPYHLQVKDQKIFAFAGLYDVWKDVDGKIIKSCTIITTEPNKTIKKIHDRMPVILQSRDYETWLKGNDLDKVKKLLVPYEQELIISPVTNKMNSVKYQESDSIKPVKPSEQLKL
jgi:putative SOS response-associated peptidase YedK